MKELLDSARPTSIGLFYNKNISYTRAIMHKDRSIHKHDGHDTQAVVLGRCNWPSSHGAHWRMEFHGSDEEIGQVRVSSRQSIQYMSQNCLRLIGATTSMAHHINVSQAY